MPYEIDKAGDSWQVRKQDDGKVMGTHATKSKAARQLAAIYANEGKQASGAK